VPIGEILTIVLASAGGAAVVVGGMGAWLGRVWADRIVESQRANYARDLEIVKSELDRSRSLELRNSAALFARCENLWSHLADLKDAGDRLWERASRENIRQFFDALVQARTAAARGRLILPEELYRHLQLAFRAFEEFRFGKLQLIELRSEEAFDRAFQMNSDEMIQDRIDQNAAAKAEYERIIDAVLKQLRTELGFAHRQA
jgi:hypothetical protein